MYYMYIHTFTETSHLRLQEETPLLQSQGNFLSVFTLNSRVGSEIPVKFRNALNILFGQSEGIYQPLDPGKIQDVKSLMAGGLGYAAESRMSSSLSL